MNKKQAKILIVEDEPQINRLIELTLISDGFFNISKAYNGIEALNKIKENKPDLILLDVMLPELDGYNLCKIIKKDSYLKNIQIIMLTAKQEDEDILKGFECGVIDYITKPFSNKILLARINAHLNNVEFLYDNNFSLDDLRKNLVVDGEKINLTKFEYEIMKIMLSSPNRVFSRSQLLNYLRGEDSFEVSERAIDVQILNIRKKLGKYASKIETVRGMGYCFRG